MGDPDITPIFEFCQDRRPGGYLVAVNDAARSEDKLNRTAEILATVLDLSGLFCATRFANQRRPGLCL